MCIKLNNRSIITIGIVILLITVLLPPIIVYLYHKDQLVFSPDSFINEWIKISVTSIILVFLIERLKSFQRNRTKNIERFESFVSPLIELKKEVTLFKNSWNFDNEIHKSQLKSYNKEISRLISNCNMVKKESLNIITDKKSFENSFKLLLSILEKGSKYNLTTSDLDIAIEEINKLIIIK